MVNSNLNWYAADFETDTTHKDTTFVWAWGISEIKKDVSELLYYGTDIETFMETAFTLGGTYWFHNEKFDGSFILNFLFKNDFSYTDKGIFDMDNHTFKSVINSMGQMYQIVIKNNNKTIKIQNSLLKIPKSIKAIGESLNLDVTKGEIDYKKYRPEGGDLTEEDYEYLERDVVILAKAMYELHAKNNNTKLTIGADCLNVYKQMCKNYDKLFGDITLEEDKFIRKAYNGGYVYCNPKYQNKMQYNGTTFDKNSMYPGVMHSSSGYLFPYGKPVYFEGLYQANNTYPIYVQHIEVGYAKLKENRWPTINLGIFKSGAHSEYATEIINKELTLTYKDLEWFLKNYDVDMNTLFYIDGYMFKAGRGYFDEYINTYMDLKIRASKSKNKVERELAKLMLNNLYGKFGTNPIRISKVPCYDKKKKKLIYMNEKEYWEKRTQSTHDLPSHDLNEYKIQGYIPVAVFTTAYARNELWTAIEAVWEYFCYCDTDSIHILLDGLETALNTIPVDDNKLGWWKQESVWDKGLFIRPKTYCEHIIKEGLKETDYWNIKACGMPQNIKDQIKIEDFKIGSQWLSSAVIREWLSQGKFKLALSKDYILIDEAKLVPKQVDGGVILVERAFKIS